MVNYAADADVRKKRRPRLSPAEIKERQAARDAQRSRADWEKHASNIVYRQLGMADRSVQQLRAALAKRNVPSDIQESTLEKFQESGLVNDEKFACQYVQMRFAARAISRRALRNELQKKGISSELAELALEQISAEDEAAAAQEFAQRKMATMQDLPREVVYRRISGALARRGFPASVIYAAVEIAYSQHEDEADSALNWRG